MKRPEPVAVAVMPGNSHDVENTIRSALRRRDVRHQRRGVHYRRGSGQWRMRISVADRRRHGQRSRRPMVH